MKIEITKDEYAALNAVAEAAKHLNTIWNDCNCEMSTCKYCSVRQALSALTTLRSKEGR